VIVDTPSGAAPDTLDLVAASDMILLVVSPEPTAFMDAYATAKMLTLDHGATQISVVSNMVDDIAAGHDLFRRFRDVAARFLPSELDFLGSIPPDAAASQALGRLARTIDALQLPARQGGDCFFGMEALIGAY
jgi:flagellar biosynthesis protein FlhG